MPLKKINARFNSKCASTGKTIEKGQSMYYDYSSKKCYCIEVGEERREAEAISKYEEAQENAYFERLHGSDNYYSGSYRGHREEF